MAIGPKLVFDNSNKLVPALIGKDSTNKTEEKARVFSKNFIQQKPSNSPTAASHKGDFLLEINENKYNELLNKIEQIRKDVSTQPDVEKNYIKNDLTKSQKSHVQKLNHGQYISSIELIISNLHTRSRETSDAIQLIENIESQNDSHSHESILKQFKEMQINIDKSISEFTQELETISQSKIKSLENEYGNFLENLNQEKFETNSSIFDAIKNHYDKLYDIIEYRPSTTNTDYSSYTFNLNKIAESFQLYDKIIESENDCGKIKEIIAENKILFKNDICIIPHEINEKHYLYSDNIRKLYNEINVKLLEEAQIKFDTNILIASEQQKQGNDIIKLVL